MIRSALASFLLLLAACGGGSDGSPDGAADAPSGVDARDDAAAPDAPAPDALGFDHVIYGLLDGNLVVIDPASGASPSAATTIGPSAADARFAWDPDAGVMRAIVSPLASPTLGTVDRCTGTVTAGPAITLDGGPVSWAEGLARGEDGTWYVCVDGNGDPAGTYLSETFGRIDVATGVVTSLGTLDTLQDDCDTLTTRGASVVALDVDYPTTAALYTVATATATATELAPLDAEVHRVTWDASREIMFGYDPYQRELVTIDLGTGATTPIGSTHEGPSPSAIPAFTAMPHATCP